MKYDHTGFPEDENSLGYTVDVYQESINNTFSEYLVNFPYLIRVMENYGFALVTPEESKSMGLPHGSGLFSELYDTMMAELNRNPSKTTEYGEADKLTSEEKQISFLNRYFVFRKTHSVNAGKVAKLLKQQTEADEDETADEIIARVEKEDASLEEPVEKKKINIILLFKCVFRCL